MPRTNDLQQYPREFAHLLLRAQVTVEPIELTFPEKKYTMRFRHRFYSYMKLLREGEGMEKRLAEAASTVRLELSPDHLRLRFMSCADGWEGELIRAAFGLEKGAPTPNAVSDALRVKELADAAKVRLAEVRAGRS